MNLKLKPCLKPLYAPSGHAQTLMAFLLPSKHLNDWGKRIDIDLPDGDRLVARLIEGPSKTVVYLFHGLSGSVASNYMERTAQVALSLGHTVMLMNHRGCGEGQGLAQFPYHSGRAEDLSAAIEKGKEIFPKHKHLAIGYSLSANALLLLLTKRRGKVLPDFAIAVNGPIHLESASLNLKTGLNKIYEAEFVRVCRQDVKRIYGKSFKLPRRFSLYDFDEIYTAPKSGFESRDDYYKSCSTYEHLHEIETPTIILSAKDDPFIETSYYEKAKLSPMVHLHLEDNGGHLGYLTREKTPLGTNRWLDYALGEMMKSFVN